MLAHAIRATFVIRKGSEDLHKKVHRYSLIVWLVWLISYIGGIWLVMGSKLVSSHEFYSLHLPKTYS
jgi:hypothetical protein